jgi:hypothetical protein
MVVINSPASLNIQDIRFFTLSWTSFAEGSSKGCSVATSRDGGGKNGGGDADGDAAGGDSAG